MIACIRLANAGMKWIAILSESEAVGAILDGREGRNYGSEAVNHFGGTFREAFRVHRTVRALMANSRCAAAA